MLAQLLMEQKRLRMLKTQMQQNAATIGDKRIVSYKQADVNKGGSVKSYRSNMCGL